jgi:hypothetical protein
MRIHLVCIFILLPLTVLAGPVEHTQQLELPVEGVQNLQITCEAGFLKLYGVDGADHIKVTATVKIDSIPPDSVPAFLEQHVLLILEKRSTKAFLESAFKNENQMAADAKIDLSVAVPKNLPVRIEDGSGRIEVKDLGADLKINDGSGSIQITDTRGNVEIEDGSGKIQIDEVEGNLEVRDGSGTIAAANISGDVYIVDSSGDMTVKDIDGNLTVRDGSGAIEIQNVTQNVLIKEAGSGSLDIDGVKGKVTTWGSGNQ